MTRTKIPFVAPIATAGLAGFPDRLRCVAEARRVVEAARLPVVRSRHAWLEAANRLTLAEVGRSPAQIEVARVALSLAVAGDRLAASSPERWAAAA